MVELGKHSIFRTHSMCNGGYSVSSFFWSGVRLSELEDSDISFCLGMHRMDFSQTILKLVGYLPATACPQHLLLPLQGSEKFFC